LNVIFYNQHSNYISPLIASEARPPIIDGLAFVDVNSHQIAISIP